MLREVLESGTIFGELFRTFQHAYNAGCALPCNSALRGSNTTTRSEQVGKGQLMAKEEKIVTNIACLFVAKHGWTWVCL